jgi:outer membrane protein insertion porin family
MSVRHLRGWGLTAVLAATLDVVVAGSTTPAQVDRYVGQPVADVTLVSEGRTLRDPSILDLVETEVGLPLSMRQVRESLTHLFSIGTFEDVRVAGGQLEHGVSLEYQLVPLAVIERIDIEGDTGLSRGDLRAAIAEAHGVAFEASVADSVSDTLLRVYRARGFLRSRVSTRVEGEGASRTLHVTVEAGQRARLAQIFVTGVSSTLYPSTLSRLDLQTGQTYDGAVIDRRLLEFETELKEERYYQARLTHTIDVAAGGASVDLRLDIRRGPRIALVFAGDDVPGGDPTALVQVEREGSVDEDLLEDADRRIEGFLNGLGYRDATVRHSRETDGDELSIVFTIDRGRLHEIGAVVFNGPAAVPPAELERLVDLSFGQPLVTRELDAAVSAVAEYYSRLGFATVNVQPVISEMGRPPATDDVMRVRCQIEVVEGALSRIRSVAVDGNQRRSSVALEAVISSRVGEPYYAPQVVADRDAIRLQYLNAGFERVVVTVEPRFDDSLEAVDLLYRVGEGPQVVIEHVLIVGNDGVDSDLIRREVTLREGEPLSLVEVAETRRRLNAMGLFRRIDIREFSHGGPELQDVVIIVDEAPATRLGYGGGLEASVRLRRETDVEGRQAVERLEFAPRGFFQIGRQNLWGKNRSIDFFMRASLRRKNDLDSLAPGESSSGLGFNEYRVLGTFQEPRVLGSAWNGFITGFVEQAIRPGFDLFSRGVNAQVTRQVTPQITTAVDYGWGQNNTTNIQVNPEDARLVDRLFPEVRLSVFSGSVARDTRDDPADPRQGEVLSIDAEVAARAIGSEVGFIKTFMQAFVYRVVPGAPRLVVAAGARVGLARAFVRSVTRLPLPPDDPEGLGDVTASPVEIEIKDGELPLSERFFAGGDSTVRGFALDRLGDDATIDQDGFPQGGNATLIFNGEVRARVTRTIDLVGFLDAGNVYDRVRNASLARIRGGAGFGVRYRSPVGPIRVDLGFKLDRQTFDNGDVERPTTLHISIGQAF